MKYDDEGDSIKAYQAAIMWTTLYFYNMFIIAIIYDREKLFLWLNYIIS